jgi:hypothetical protein
LSDKVTEFQFLCDILRWGMAEPEVESLRGRLAETPDPWPGIIDQANLHYLTPALSIALHKKGLANLPPKDVEDYLGESLRLNRIRNEGIRQQCDQLVAALNGEGITPVLLKGGVYLYSRDDEAFGARMMVDLDILVPPVSWERSIETAFGLGYEIIDEHQAWTHDYHSLGRADDPASVEFHKDVGKQRVLLSRAEAIDAAVAIGGETLRLGALSPTQRVLHNIFHGAIQDRAHELRRIPLRSLHDLGLIMEAQGGDIEWPEVSQIMAVQGYGSVLNTYWYMADRFLGLPVPVTPVGAAAARRRVKIAFLQINHSLPKSIVDLWASASLPFTQTTIDYIYDTPGCPWRRQAARWRHFWRLIKMHRWGVVQKLAKVYRGMYRPSVR